MASSRAIMILSLFALALPHSVVQARMMPSDQPQMLAEKTISPPRYSSSPDLLQVFRAPPPPIPVTFAGNIEITGAKRRRASQVVVKGSVPSPGVGHH
ncbi:hypothetical protein CFC21_001322 [Triticum aestivum]|uniref:Dirigent protein n=2 Tax=Triticum TaxID=4564 RepID=M7YJ76_TRIUA|nr:hypothetical protein TRIUR3_14388 [Triticum urartu]KAF6983023.1 hypothetical protein CFC21_001322 [Triticum aestivum]